MRPLLLLLFILTACAQPPANAPTTSANEPAMKPTPTTETTETADTSGELTVIGKITAEGVECKAMRADGTNELYTLAGNTGAFKAGDHVKVVGKIAEISFCMQGKTIAVKTITRL
jgi:hypothetical protein